MPQDRLRVLEQVEFLKYLNTLKFIDTAFECII